MFAFSHVATVACFAVVTLAAAYDAVVKHAARSMEVLDEALYEAAGDGFCVVAAFLVVLGCSTGVQKFWKERQLRRPKGKKPKVSQKVQPIVKEIEAPEDPVPVQQSEARESKTFSRAAIEGERDSLARAVSSGRADELPRLLNAAVQRVASKVTQPALMEDVVQKYVLSALKACAKHRFFSQALAAYDQLIVPLGQAVKCGCIWSILLYAAVEASEFDRCEEFLDLLLESGGFGSHDFINMVRYLAHQQDEQGMDAVLAKLQRTPFTLDVQSRNRALAGCIAAGAPAFGEHLLTATEAWAKADTVAFNTLMKGYAQERNVQRCFWLQQQMECCGLAASEVTYGILIDACVESGRLDDAAEIIQKLRCDGDGLNVVHFTTFLKGLLNQGHIAEARNVLTEVMADSVIKPDLIACSLVVKALAEEGSIMDALEVLDEMHRIGVKPDTMLFHHILSGHSCRCNALPVIKEFFEILVQRGLKPTTVTMSIMTKAYARCEAWDAALAELEAAPKRYGFSPEPRVFCQLAQACARSRDPTLTIHIYAAALNAARAQGQVLAPEMHDRFIVYCDTSGERSAAELLRRGADRRRQSFD